MKIQASGNQEKLLNIRLLFILVTLGEILGTLIIAGGLSWLSKTILNRVIEIPDITGNLLEIQELLVVLSTYSVTSATIHDILEDYRVARIE